MQSAGVHAVLVDREEKAMALSAQIAKRRMHRIPEVMQDALPTELTVLYHTPNGSSDYVAQKKGRVNGTDMRLGF